MNLFDSLVDEAIKNQPNLSPLRIVVEKELLHHDILRVLSQHNFLKDLTFIGGTCLRCCYGASRLSEDLDFTGGRDFTRDSLSTMGEALTDTLQEKYGLVVKVSDPIKDKNIVDTWKVRIETRGPQRNIPAQRINIDICSVPSYEKRPMMLLNPYGVERGTGGLILQAQSREEIYTDKLLAFAFRPNRIKYRDVWDMVWLHEQGLKPNFNLIPHKLQDRHYTMDYFLTEFEARKKSLTEVASREIEFQKEMRRFLSSDKIKTLEQDNFWDFIVYLIDDLDRQMRKNRD